MTRRWTCDSNTIKRCGQLSGCHISDALPKDVIGTSWVSIFVWSRRPSFRPWPIMPSAAVAGDNPPQAVVGRPLLSSAKHGERISYLVRRPNVRGEMLVQMNSEDWKDIAIEFNGKHVKGRFDVVAGLVTVISWNGTKKAHLGRFAAEKVAKILLRELASEVN